MSPRAEQIRGPGARVLALLGYRPVSAVLPELARRSRRPSQIERGYAVASTTFHKHAPELLEIGAISREVVPGPPRQVVYGLGPTGTELCELLDGWVSLLGGEPDSVDWRTPQRVSEAWAAGVAPALLDDPLPLAEIEGSARATPPRPSTHQVRRLLDNLLAAGFAERRDERYAITESGRLAVGELVAGVRFERRHLGSTAVRITPEDSAQAIRGTLPLITLCGHPDGICEFAVKGEEGENGAAVALTWAEFRGGRVVASGLGAPPRPPATWAQGTIDQWLEAVIDHRPRILRAAGECGLGRHVLDQLHSRVFARRR